VPRAIGVIDSRRQPEARRILGGQLGGSCHPLALLPRQRLGVLLPNFVVGRHHCLRGPQQPEQGLVLSDATGDHQAPASASA
jgi:hypothetical protein